MYDDEIKNNISMFRMQMMLKMPFFGEILSKIDIIECREAESAMTDGRAIYYNRSFFKKLLPAEQNYVLMHELFHIILLHFKRSEDKDPQIWNVASDYVVNGMLDRLIRACEKIAAGRSGYDCYFGIDFEKPPVGCFLENYNDESVEQLYSRILRYNKKNRLRKNVLILLPRYDGAEDVKEEKVRLDPKDFDLICTASDEEGAKIEAWINQLIENAMKKWSDDPSVKIIKRELDFLKNEKLLPWKRVMKRFLSDGDDMEDVSYSTPERKYIHMDMILPGPGTFQVRNKLDDVWAFIDSSGSIDRETMNSFITQLYELCRQFDAKLNIAFWDNQVNEVYKEVGKKDLMDCSSCSTGGTNAGSVYDYLDANKVKARAVIILTDGYFARVPSRRCEPYRKKTIVVISKGGVPVDSDMGMCTRIA